MPPAASAITAVDSHPRTLSVRPIVNWPMTLGLAAIVIMIAMIGTATTPLTLRSRTRP